MRFLVDENLSPKVAELLTEQSHDVLFVPTSKYRGQSDLFLHDLAREEGRIVITRDLGFPVTERLPGLILVRGGNQSPRQLVGLMQRFIQSPAFDNVPGRITVLAPGREPRSRRIGNA
jgi:predicted nuclease of predicted toxin-antitoxin system